MITVAFTGHRPQKLGFEWDYEGPYSDYIVDQLTGLLIKLNPDDVITGMALGFDTIAVLTAMTLDIPFIAAIPFEGQECKWNPQAQELYWKILNHKLCQQKVYVSPPGYAAWKMQKRNTLMVDKSTLMISCWDGSDGGTGNCCRFADQVGRRRINIDPRCALKY